MAYGRKIHLREPGTGVTSSTLATRTACERYRPVPAVVKHQPTAYRRGGLAPAGRSRAISKCMAMCCRGRKRPCPR